MLSVKHESIGYSIHFHPPYNKVQLCFKSPQRIQAAYHFLSERIQSEYIYRSCDKKCRIKDTFVVVVVRHTIC